MVEYRLTLQTIFENKDFAVGEENELLVEQARQFMQKVRRGQLLMEYNGQMVSPYYVLEQIDRDIELQSRILSDKDRELYEEIVMNSVGRIIRNRINRAEQWVKKIDELMRQRNTSSGLTLSLRWRPLAAEREEELDTVDLVSPYPFSSSHLHPRPG